MNKKHQILLEKKEENQRIFIKKKKEKKSNRMGDQVTRCDIRNKYSQTITDNS